MTCSQRLMIQPPRDDACAVYRCDRCLLHLHKAPPPDSALCDADGLTDAARMCFDWYAPDSDAAAEFKRIVPPIGRILTSAPA